MATAQSRHAGEEQVTTHLKVGGMSCSFCAESIRKAVGREKGVDEVHVSLAHEEALVRFRPSEVTEDRIEETLRALGYTIRDPREVRTFEEERAAMSGEKRDLITAASFAGIAFLGMVAMWLDLWTMRVWHTWAAWGMASFVFFWSGRRIIRMAWGAARRGILNQHVLLTAGAVGGYIGGLLGMPWPAVGWWGLEGFPATDFFGVVMFLTTYHLLSGYVSLLVRTRASQSVKKLLDLQPPTARVVREGREEEVAIDDVETGDRVRIRPGERVPVDGEVVEGGSAVDQSLVTGEPIPEEKEAGDEVIGGSVNQTGTLLVRVTRVGEESFLRQVARHVEEAKALKPGIIVLVDRVLEYYVPAVLLIAAGALLFWSVGWGFLAGAPLWTRAVYAAVAVLVMGYPCSLGMATPLALIRGGGMAAERGILMRSGEAFQILEDIAVVVLDKTGTITRGEPRVVEVIPFGTFRREEVLHYAASAESPSEHPLARAIVECAEEEAIAIGPAEMFDSITGGGVEARVDGRAVFVGKPALLVERNVDVGSAEEALAREEERGRTGILLEVEGELAGLVGIADAVKPDAGEAIDRMKELGLTPIMLTGDAERTARAVAREVGIDEVSARVLPDQKAERVRQLQQDGRRVAFVGDGINDAPALMQADVGIAIGAGTDIAIESSDVILIGERLSAVVDACHIGENSYRKTVQNLWLAFIFNGIGVPLAATGIVHPVWAMIAMAASVTAVLTNSFGGRLLPAGEGPRAVSGAKESEEGKGEVPPAAAKKPEGTTSPEAVEAISPAAEAPGEAQPQVTATEVHTMKDTKPSELAEAILEVPDMHCAGCENNIETLLRDREGVEELDADAETKRVRIRYRPERIGLGEIERDVTSLGYRVQQAYVPGKS